MNILLILNPKQGRYWEKNYPSQNQDTTDGRIGNEDCLFSYRDINCQGKWSDANKMHFNAEKYVSLV